LADARQYYKAVLKKFLQLCYESWRRELFASVAVTAITYALTFRDKGAWESTKIALEANLILLLVFSVLHLVRTPFLVHSDTVAAFPEAESKPERIFVKEGITPKYLIEQFSKHTAMRAEEIIAPYIGNWMQVSGTVYNVAKLSGENFYVQLHVDPEKDSILLGLTFGSIWKDKLVLLRKGDSISVRGKFAEANPISLSLKECELEET
jgi:hypothetical protein